MKVFQIAILLCVCAYNSILAQSTNVSESASITIDGVTYENVRWSTVTPATVSILHRTGVATIPLEKLPPELQIRFGYDAKKAADYRAVEVQRAKQRMAREKELNKLKAQQDEENRKQAAEAAAIEAATIASNQVVIVSAKQAAETAAKKASQDFEAKLGSVTQLRFSYNTIPKQLPNGRYCANLIYLETTTGEEGRIYVEFPPAGLNFMNTTTRFSNGNGWSIYGRPYTAQLQNMYGASFTETAYWLIGANVAASGYASW